MSKWKNIVISRDMIKAETPRSVLFYMPYNSEYKGYCFWHPAKVIRGDCNFVSLGYTDEFVFRLKKYGQGRYNKGETIEELEITAEDFERAFDGNPELEPLLYEPEPLEPENATAHPDLIDEV